MQPYETIFLSAREMKDPAERAAYLAGACGDDAGLRRQVESLLADASAATSFFPEDSETSYVFPTERLTTLPPTGFAEIPGTVIGRYTLRERIGFGGMGEVYIAEQREPFHRLVALKLIKLGMDTKDIVARFEAERQALALMDHPNIAKVFDAGSTDTGRPYFVMELVRGETLTRFCDQHQMDTEARLELFLQVCAAVQHAHQKGVIHRDLKPSNILVALHDGKPVPKVIDFGIAKATQDSAVARTYDTLRTQRMGTPPYMSPEQSGLDDLDVDTRSDIYSLGVVLYELLVGVTPFDVKALRREGGEERVLRAIREEDPLKPSTRLNRLGGEELTAVANQRKAVPSKLTSALRGNLDAIVMKALEKDRNRRFVTVNALAAYLRRHLAHEVVDILQPSTTYRLSRLVRRHRVAVAAGGAVALALVLGILGTSWGLWQARENLRTALLEQARANCWSGRAGRRFDSLEALTKAAQIRPSIELRNAAIACLTLPDVRVERALNVGPLVPKVGTVCFDPSFQQVAAVLRDGSITLRQARDGREICRFQGPANPSSVNILISQDGNFLAYQCEGSGMAELRVWSLPHQECVITQTLTFRCMAFSPDSSELAVAEAGGLVHFFDLGHSKESRRLSLPLSLNQCAYAPDGRRLAVADESGLVHILDVRSGQEQQVLRGSDKVGRPAWSPNERLIAGPCYDGQVYLWDVQTGQTNAILPGHTSGATGAVFNHAGDLLATLGWDGMTRFWDPMASRPLVSITGGWSPSGFDPTDQYLGFGAGNKSNGVWRVEAARECRRLGSVGVVWGGAFSVDDRLLAVAGATGVKLWTLQNLQSNVQLPIPESRCAVFQRGGEGFFVSGLSGLRYYPIHWSNSAAKVGPMEALSSERLEQSSLSGDSGSLLSAAPLACRVLKTGQARSEPTPSGAEHQFVTHLSSSADGKWFATGTWKGDGVRVWRSEDRKLETQLPVPGSATCAFSPDNRWLVTGSSEEYRFWATGTWTPGLAIPREAAGDMPGTMAFAPDSSVLAVLVGRNTGVRLVSVPDGAELATLDAGKPLCFSHDGCLLVTLAEDQRSLLLWDLAAIRKQLATMGLDWAKPPLKPGIAVGSGGAVSVRVATAAGQ